MITKVEMKSSAHFSQSYNSKTAIHKNQNENRKSESFAEVLKNQLNKHK